MLIEKLLGLKQQKLQALIKKRQIKFLEPDEKILKKCKIILKKSFKK